MKTVSSILATSILSLFISGSPAMARTITSNGSGSSSGTCSYGQGQFCINDLRDRAERAGQDQARWSCQVSGGQPLTYTTYCSSSCYPNVINPGASTWVTCNSNCSMQCEVN